MFLLDTNVISELRKGKSKKANKNVLKWAKSISPSFMFLSVITILEIEIGIRGIERKDHHQGALLRTWMDNHVMTTFSDRILYFDTAVAKRCAELHVPDRKSDRDSIIAATALTHGMTIVTRNLQDFNKIDVEVINPFV